MTMNKPIILVAALATALTFASSARAEAIFIGRLMVTGSQGSCDFNPVESRINARWMPSNLAGNPDASTLSLYNSFIAFNYVLEGARFTGTPKAVKARALVNFDSPIGFTPKIAFTSVSAALTGATEMVNVEGSMQGWEFMPNCDVTFRISFLKRI